MVCSRGTSLYTEACLTYFRDRVLRREACIVVGRQCSTCYACTSHPFLPHAAKTNTTPTLASRRIALHIPLLINCCNCCIPYNPSLRQFRHVAPNVEWTTA